MAVLLLSMAFARYAIAPILGVCRRVGLPSGDASTRARAVTTAGGAPVHRPGRGPGLADESRITDLRRLASDALVRSGLPVSAATVIGPERHRPVRAAPDSVLHALAGLIEGAAADAGAVGIAIRIEPLSAADGESIRVTVESDGGDWSGLLRATGRGPCRDLAAEPGVSFGADGVAGAGGRVWFCLPVMEAAAPGRTGQEDVKLRRGRVRLLVVEDNEINREILLRMLERSGFQAQSVATGREAVEAVSRGGIDGVLMDLHMPGVDGIEATRLIRSLAGDTARTPIVALTADTLLAVRTEATQAGVNAFLVKPVEWDELSSILDRLAIGPCPSAGSHPPSGMGSPMADADDAGGPDAGSLLDRRQIEQIAARIGRDRLATLNERLMHRLRSDLAGMQAAAAEGASDRVRSLAHRAKGSCGMLGWHRCAALLDRLQSDAPGTGRTQDLLGLLAMALDDTCGALARRPDRGPSGSRALRRFDEGLRQG